MYGKFASGQTQSNGLNNVADVMRFLINVKSERMLRGDRGAVVMPTTSLDIRFDIPDTTQFTPDKIGEGAKGSLKKMDTFPITGSLDKFNNTFTITHEVVARGTADSQTQMSLSAASKGLAFQRDSDMFATFQTGIGATVTAPDTWDDVDGLADPASDIANAIGSILDNTYLLEDETNSISIFVPAVMYPHLAKPMDIFGVQQTIQKWAEDQYKVDFNFTRQLTTNALVMVKSEETAIHLDYVGNDVPLSWVTEDEVGITYSMSNYFKTIIMEDTEGSGTTSNIVEIENIVAP